MGVGPFYKRSRSALGAEPIKSPNPNPLVFVVEHAVDMNGHCVASIHYPDCTNYEGRKILMFKDYSVEQLRKQKAIDPHFCNDSKYKHPFARFEPCELGWDMAIELCRLLENK